MQGFLQKFLANPDQDLAAYQKTIQDFWDALPPLSDLHAYPDAMSGPNQPDTAALPVPPAGGAAAVPPRKGRRYRPADPARQARRSALMVGDPDLPVHLVHLVPDGRLVRPVVHQLARDRGADRRELHRPEELRAAVHDLSVLLAGGLAQHPVAAGVRVHRHADRHLPRRPARSRDARDAHLPERVLHPGRPVAGGRRVHLGTDVHVAGVHQQRPRPDQPGQRHRLAREPDRSTSGRSWSRPAGARSAT